MRLIPFIFFFSVFLSYAQENSKDNSVQKDSITINQDSLIQKHKFFNLGDVDVSEFKMQAIDSSDVFDAVYILNREVVYFSNYSKYFQYRIVHRRIRIENEQGLNYATQYINKYQLGNSKEDLISLVGSTYNLVDGEIKKTELRKSAIFEKDANEYYKVTSFTMPDVQVGSIIEFRYKVGSKTAAIDDIDFQFEVPVLNADIEVSFPSRGIYNVIFNPRASYILSFNEEDFKDNIASSTIKAEDDDEFGNSIETKQLRFSGRPIGFRAKDIPALKPEELSGNLDKYRGKMIMNLAAIKYPSGKIEKEFAATWNDVAKTIYDSDQFGKPLRRTGYFKSDILSLIESLNSQEEKMISIYNYVKAKVKWNGDYGVYSSEKIKEVYKSGSGKVADINLMLISMLNEAGLEAFPVLVSSQNNDLPIFPTLSGFNYVICQVNVDGKSVLLDATERFAGPNLLPLRAANWKGRLIKKDGSSEWVKLTDNQKSQEITLMDVSFDEFGEVSGKLKKRLSNYMALNFRNRNINSTETELIEYFRNDNVGLNVSNYEIKNLDSSDVFLDYEYELKYSNGIDKVANKLFVTPLLFESNEENPFKLEKRELPLDLSFPINSKTVVIMKIPEGYELASSPENVKLLYKEGVGSYTYITKVEKNKITTIADFKLNTSVILPNSYDNFKKFFEAIVQKDAEKIVFQKL